MVLAAGEGNSLLQDFALGGGLAAKSLDKNKERALKLRLEGLREGGGRKLEGRKYEEERERRFFPVEQRKSNEGRSTREVLPATGNGSLMLQKGLCIESLASNRGRVVSAPFSASGETEKCCSTMGGGACAGSTHERRIFRSFSKRRLEVSLGSLRCDNWRALCVTRRLNVTSERSEDFRRRQSRQHPRTPRHGAKQVAKERDGAAGGG